GVKKKKFAYSPDLGYAVVDPEVLEVTRKAAFDFADAGYSVEEVKVDFPNMEGDLVNQVVAETVAAYGDRLEEWKKVCYKPYLDFLWLADALKAVDYVKTQYRRKELWEKVRRVFEKYDFLLTPATAIPAFNLELGMGPSQIAGKPVGPVGWIAFTYPFNFTGQPAASVPCGFTKGKLPVGLQIVGNRFDDLGVLQAARAFEKTLPWQDKKPPI
ncbi:MAG: amidase family protein, partial [Candidatus Freyarchaeota archaeon]